MSKHTQIPKCPDSRKVLSKVLYSLNCTWYDITQPLEVKLLKRDFMTWEMDMMQPKKICIQTVSVIF